MIKPHHCDYTIPITKCKCTPPLKSLALAAENCGAPEASEDALGKMPVGTVASSDG
ncbi:hypothetical protein GJAV_G00121530 [Gymnothorax javanicus]|nr:hypothetical protein GJAV_G00121530 [Gymnothorax javanicus]